MSKHEIVRAWKDAGLRKGAAVEHPAGERLGRDELQNVAGAAVGCGYICSVSGDCWGFSCNPFYQTV